MFKKVMVDGIDLPLILDDGSHCESNDYKPLQEREWCYQQWSDEFGWVGNIYSPEVVMGWVEKGEAMPVG